MKQAAETTKSPSEMSPREVDTILADLYDRIGAAVRNIDYIRASLDRETYLPARTRFQDQITTAQKTLRSLEAETGPYNAEYIRRNWNRYFLVTNGNGHVHRGRDCSTCFHTTSYSWLVDLSGCDETAMVAEYGEKACTVCFPDAPSMYQAMGKLSRTAQAAADAKAARQAKRAEAAAKKAAKAIANPDGTVLKGTMWRIETLAAAKQELLSTIGSLVHCLPGSMVDQTRPEYEAARDRIAAAIAHKTGGDAEAIKAEAQAKVEKRGW